MRTRKMEISVNLPETSGSSLDDEMTFITQLGLNLVNISAMPTPQMPGTPIQTLERLVKRIQAAHLKAHLLRFTILDALFNRPGGEDQLSTACKIITFAGQASIPLIWVWPLGIRQGPALVPGRYPRAHRGGYEMSAWSVEGMREELAKRDLTSRWAHHFTEKMSAEEYVSNLVKALRRIVPVAEAAGVKLMLHFDDPPVPDEANLLPGIVNPLLITRVFEAVPSDHLGLLFCVGTRYESGVDVYDQIRLFGRRNKIFHVHFRNVRGTIPSAGGYEEVALDDGDLDMFRILKALQATGYDGSLSPDHPMILIGDEQRRASLAYHVGYMKALLAALS
jgi:mannonate dehydratase